MSSQITLLSEITKFRMDFKIQVRVCRQWKTQPKSKIHESLDYLFVDMQGTRIHASVKKLHILKYENKVQEGDVCYVHRFSVVESPKVYQIAECPFRILFHASTLIKTCEDPSFPIGIFNLREFSKITDGSIQKDGPVFDVIGRVVDISEDRMKSDANVKGSKSITFLIEDLNKLRVQCLLWEPYCFELKNHFDMVRDKKDPQVIIIQLCRAKEFEKSVGVSNTYNATKLITDQNTEEIIDFKSKLNITEVSNSFDGSQISTSTYMSVKDDLASPKTVFFTVDELKAATVTEKFWVIASIAEIRPIGGWCYISCPVCKKKVEEKEDQFWCSWCKKFVIAEERFKVHLTVVDGASNAVFLLWNETAKSMIGKSVDEVWEKLFQDAGITDPDERQKVTDFSKFGCPQPIEALIGNEYLFKVEVTERHIALTEKVYQVERYSNDQTIIQKHKKNSHDIIPSSMSTEIESLGEAISVHEDNGSQTFDEVKTPEFPKSAKRNLSASLQETEEHSSTKAHKSA